MNCCVLFYSDNEADVPSLAYSLIAHPSPYKPFLPLLHHSTNADDPIALLTSTFLTNIVSTSLVDSSKSAPRDEEALPQLYGYLSTLVKNQDNGLQDIGVQDFSALLRTKRSREIFWSSQQDTVKPLIDILRSATGAKDNGSTSSTLVGSSSIRSLDPGLGGGVGLQLLYRILLVLWQLSFEGGLVGNDLQEYVDLTIMPISTMQLCLRKS